MSIYLFSKCPSQTLLIYKHHITHSQIN